MISVKNFGTCLVVCGSTWSSLISPINLVLAFSLLHPGNSMFSQLRTTLSDGRVVEGRLQVRGDARNTVAITLWRSGRGFRPASSLAKA